MPVDTHFAAEGLPGPRPLPGPGLQADDQRLRATDKLGVRGQRQLRLRPARHAAWIMAWPRYSKNWPMSCIRAPAGVAAPRISAPSRAPAASATFWRALATHARNQTSASMTYRSRRRRGSRSRRISSCSSSSPIDLVPFYRRWPSVVRVAEIIFCHCRLANQFQTTHSV
jgi:hypothetical protein